MEEYGRNTFLLYHTVTVGSWRAWCCKSYIYASRATIGFGTYSSFFEFRSSFTLEKKFGLPYLLSGRKREAVGLVLLRLEEEFSTLFF